MKSIKVLDVTLRDGGCVNGFNFGQAYMDKILSNIEKSGVDYIEVGYIDQNKGSEQGRTEFCNEKVISQYFLKRKLPNINYVAMIDYGKFDVNLLENRQDNDIDGIRIAFHKKNWQDAIKSARIILDKGYKVFIQPMLSMRYSDNEMIDLITTVNSQIPEATGFYIVDTFGEMRSNDIIRLMHLIDHNLKSDILLGFHSHNNLQLSYSNAMTLLEFPTNRQLMLDASVMGMGKGAGNLNTELLIEHLNLYYGKEYTVLPLLELIDQVINVIHSELYWGYAAEYYLASINRCTPSYAGHFYNKHMLPIDQVGELLSMIDESKKISFDKDYAEKLYVEYNASKKVKDDKTLEGLSNLLKGKTIVLVAPGKSILENKEKIQNTILNQNTVSISLNNFEFNTDFVLTTRAESYEQSIQNSRKTIVMSNVAKSSNDENTFVLNYEDWIIKGEKTYDSSSVIMLNLLSKIEVDEIILVGFDGFTININDNYYNAVLRKPVTEEQSIRRNAFYKDFISNVAKNKKITFLTKSAYQES